LATISGVGICGTVGACCIQIRRSARIRIQSRHVRASAGVVWIGGGIGLSGAICRCTRIGQRVLFCTCIGTSPIWQRICVCLCSAIRLGHRGITASSIQRRHSVHTSVRAGYGIGCAGGVCCVCGANWRIRTDLAVRRWLG
jgi:hypothetical protein